MIPTTIEKLTEEDFARLVKAALPQGEAAVIELASRLYHLGVIYGRESLARRIAELKSSISTE